MRNIFEFLLNWWRKTSLIRFKTILFSLICSSVFLNQSITLDLKNLNFSYDNGSISTLTVITAAVISVIFVGLDFWTNREMVKQRENEKLFSLLQDPDLEKEIKEEILEIIRGRY